MIIITTSPVVSIASLHAKPRTNTISAAMSKPVLHSTIAGPAGTTHT